MMGRGLSDLQKQILQYVANNLDPDSDECHWLDTLHWKTRGELRERFADSIRPGKRFKWTTSDSVSVSRALSRLESRGLITRKNFGSRTRSIKLTQEGEQAYRLISKLLSRC
jgi:hypothetical protein